ncbi:probable RNA-binding protein 46 isoform X2 [Syngnathoides biaculeatus]|uniref:probable RNA-binding protein 46 isoform X2 n=1 Tax=Syngnathoides biaculeatus TaxID=300417 RepID=UPI002ADD4D92|nr:probable RNA-binding protein 46 isoform X2 [Syngnathoides biaculeatus]
MAEARYRDDRELGEDGEASSGRFNPLTDMEHLRKEQSIHLALVKLMDRTGYNMIQENGQRKYGGPPPNWVGPMPCIDCEVFVGKIPAYIYEDELVPLFETAGTIYEMRLMLELNGQNRGYGFVLEAAEKAVRNLNNHEVRRGRFVGVCLSLQKCSLFLASISKNKSKEEITEAVKEVTEGLLEVSVFPSHTGENQGFAFLEYETHKAAALARKALMARKKLWGKNIWIDWAQLEKDRKGANLHSIKTVHVCNLSPSTTAATLRREFERFKPGAVARVKKFIRHAYIHFGCHEDAVVAARMMNGAIVDGNPVAVTLNIYRWQQRQPQGGGASGVINLQNGGTDESHAVESTNPRVQWSPWTPGPSFRAAQGVFPLNPGSQLYPTDLQLLQPGQFGSAVSLLELYCCVNKLPPPRYELFSLLGPDGGFLLVYKVMMLLTQEVFMPDMLCMQLDAAKELAAEHALCGATGVVNPQHGGTNEHHAVESMNPHVQWSSQTPGASFLAAHGVFPLNPGAQLYPTNLQLLQRDQFCSAVSLLELYCCVNNLPPPHYELSQLAPEGASLLVYKVVMLLTREVYIPDVACVQLDVAKELAAEHALWNLVSRSSPTDLTRNLSPV